MSTQYCGVRGCTRDIHSRQVVCSEHWREVPTRLQGPTVRAIARGQWDEVGRLRTAILDLLDDGAPEPSCSAPNAGHVSQPSWCRSVECGAQIRFVRTRLGNEMPVDAKELNVWVPADGSWEVDTKDPDHVRVVTCGGDVVEALRHKPLLPSKPVGAFISHFSTCKRRDDFKTRKPTQGRKR